MTHYIEIAKEKLDTLKGQMDYAQNKLNVGGLEKWEAKEFSGLVDILTTEIADATEHYNLVVEM